ncbi:SDR family NAD(P)-dependent oxidoreductase [Anaeromicropila herbilytica]|uniref:Short-chain dehydrogenase n=1 Tax=Anaeromicropila herbilytica TaxID=2785025 RepID=A0A7R7EJD7_9FIRM|nr:SDR family oxidoreductase [Anaeromicropila herbilytica]BCN29877.1 short-chain dehydrogenase [Anaeromicropila herbilytica]
MKKVALITGATSGLGLAYAKEYAKKGYNLIITGRREDKIKENGKKIEERYHVTVKVVIVDLAYKKGVDILLNEMKEDEIEVLINNAGFGLKPVFSNTTKEDIDRIMYLQMNAVVILTRNILNQMLVRNRGTIINISSDGAFAVMPRNVLYSSTKLFILNFTEGLYLELIDTNIKVQVVCPGFIDSDFHQSAGMNVVKKKKGFMKFVAPEKIVEMAMKDMKKGKIISVPGVNTKIVCWIAKFLPRKLFYKFVIRFTKKRLKKLNR